VTEVGKLETLALAADYLHPRLIPADSAWLRHVPFAQWLVRTTRPRRVVELGVHSGCSYFAFCQAAQAYSPESECFGVDTWLSDDHVGSYSAEVFTQVNAHNTHLYSSFSTLLRMPFDDALERFEDGSVDLLHIDGLHTLDAVRHDFEHWLPKMSSRGVILMHDTSEFRDNFGVYAFWREIAVRYPSFAFTHGHGLGVVKVGSDKTLVDDVLFAGDADWVRAVSSLFSRLGNGIEQERELALLRPLEDRVEGLEREAIRLRAERSVGAQAAAALELERESFSHRSAELRAEIEMLTQERNEAVAVINSVCSSNTWKLGAPLRWARRVLR
jgi:hypothetical protein